MAQGARRGSRLLPPEILWCRVRCFVGGEGGHCWAGGGWAVLVERVDCSKEGEPPSFGETQRASTLRNHRWGRGGGGEGDADTEGEEEDEDEEEAVVAEEEEEEGRRKTKTRRRRRTTRRRRTRTRTRTRTRSTVALTSTRFVYWTIHSS